MKGKVTFIGVDSLETGDKNLMPDRHHLVGSFAALAQDVAGANGSGLHDALGGGNSSSSAIPLMSAIQRAGMAKHVRLPRRSFVGAGPILPEDAKILTLCDPQAR